jgi:hypothetical protein
MAFIFLSWSPSSIATSTKCVMSFCICLFAHIFINCSLYSCFGLCAIMASQRSELSKRNMTQHTQLKQGETIKSIDWFMYWRCLAIVWTSRTPGAVLELHFLLALSVLSSMFWLCPYSLTSFLASCTHAKISWRVWVSGGQGPCLCCSLQHLLLPRIMPGTHSAFRVLCPWESF